MARLTRLGVYSVTSGDFATLTVTYPAGASLTCSNGTKTLTAETSTGLYTFVIPKAGTWTLTATNGNGTRSVAVSMTTKGEARSITLSIGEITDTWVTSGYTNGRGAQINYYYTAEYEPANNRTRITFLSYWVQWNNGGVNFQSTANGTVTFAASDNTGSAQSFTVDASVKGTAPQRTYDVNQTFYVYHTNGTTKSITLSCNVAINANYYRPTIATSKAVQTAP